MGGDLNPYHSADARFYAKRLPPQKSCAHPRRRAGAGSHRHPYRQLIPYMDNLPKGGHPDQGEAVPPNTPIRLSPSAEQRILDMLEGVAEAIQGVVEAGARRGGTLAPLLDKKEVARMLSVSVRTVDTLIAEGALVPVRIRGQLRFTAEAVEALVRQSHEGRIRGSR
jgi:excisionase family DNA binding protein